MSVRVLSWVLDNSEAPGNDRLVLIAIADEADDDGTNAYPSIDRIARRARVNKRTTMRSLDRLEEMGELVIVRPEQSGRGHHNRYGVVMDREIDDVRALVLDPRKGDTLSPTRKGADGRAKARKGAPMSALDPQTLRPTDPESQDTARAPALELVAEQSSTDDDFAAFWKAYPRGDGKPAAQSAWAKAVKAAPVATIMQGLDAWLVYWQARNEPEFVPWAQKWLNQQQWFAAPPATRSKPPLGPGATGIAESWDGAQQTIRKGRR